MTKTKNMRRDYRRMGLFGLALFVTVFLFVFLAQKFGKLGSDTNAANLANFNAGYIISDYQMTNYTSMSEADIQNFLWSKGRCYNTNLRDVGTRVDYFSDHTPPTTWHVANGHTVCLAEENMGGESAAHIIWQAAQDYKINPKVLIVLLQKETGMITDPIPNSWDYQRATGYGCPDTAACSEKYYGFKNQIRNAASLFRIVMDGNSSYYPIGNNNVRYSPDPACGSSTVYIQNLATSALYRYTPYQPNAGALAAGYGTAPCGAYGNRNFYAYFEDWFGGVTSNGYESMGTPRYMKLKRDANRINPYNLEVIDKLEKGRNIKFTTKATTADGEMCLRTEYNSINDVNACIRFGDLEEFYGLDYVSLANPRYFFVPAGTDIINSKDGSLTKTKVDQKLFFDTKSYWTGGLCLRASYDTANNKQACILYDAVSEISSKNPVYEKMGNARVMKVKGNTRFYDTDAERRVGEQIKEGTKLVLSEKVMIKDNITCLRTVSDANNKENRCIPIFELSETTSGSGGEYTEMGTKRSMRLNKATDFVTTSGYYFAKSVAKGNGFYFVDKTYIDGKMCLRTIEDKNNNIARCVMFDDLSEAKELNFVPMGTPRSFDVKEDSKVVDLETGKESVTKQKKTLYFVDKTDWKGDLCLREKSDSNNNKYVCYLYSTIDEK